MMTEDYPEEMIQADDYDHLTGEEEDFKGKVKLLDNDNLLVNEDKTEDTVTNRTKQTNEVRANHGETR